LRYHYIMKPSDALAAHREQLLTFATQFNTTNPRVFGSVARGTDTKASDLDLMVDTLPGTTLFQLGGLQEALQTLLGCRVDVVSSAGLPPQIKQQLLTESRKV
jgi:uncharacterized protein